MIVKSLHIILAVFLFCNTSGFNLTVHYCADAISAITLFTNPSACSSMEKACCKKNEENKKCCSYETDFVKQDLDQISYSIDLIDYNLTSLLSKPYVWEQGEIIFAKNNISKYYRPPPKNKDLYILFENFLC